MLLNHLINTRIDKMSSILEETPGAAIDTGVLDTADHPFVALANTQIGVGICSAADQAIIDAEADGALFVIQVDSYERIDPTNVVITPSNLKRSHVSTATVYKTNGEYFVNAATTGPFNPDAVQIQVTNNLTGLAELLIGAVH